MEKELISILLIEDNATDVILLREALEEAPSFSFRLTTAERFEQGLGLLSEGTFEVVLLDLGLPDSQGLDTFKAVHAEHPDTPIIVLSGMEDEELAFEAVQAGAQDYMVKGRAGGESIARATRYAIERQRSKAVLRASEDRFRSLFEHSPVAYQSLDSDGIYIDVNEQLCEMLGYRPEELLGRSFGDLWSPETRSTFPGKFARFKRDGEMDTEVQLIKKDGNLIEVVLEGKIQYDLNGQMIKTHCILHDITERVLAEQAIRESQERFGTVFRASPISIFIATTDEIILDVNQAFLDMFGYKRAQALSHTMGELNLWHDPQERDHLIRLLGQQGDVSNHEIKYRTSSGEVGDALAFVELIELAGKQCLLVMLNDVTERKQAENAIKLAEEHFKALIENAPDGIVLLDAEGNFEYVSPSARRLFGYGAREDINFDPTEAIHPEDLQTVLTVLDDMIKDPSQIPTIQYRFKHKEGAWLWVEGTFSNLLAEPSVEAIVVNFREITERKQSETALLAAKQKYYSIFNEAIEGLFQSTPEGRFLTVNPALARMWGYASPEDMLSSIDDISSQVYVDPRHREDFIKLMDEQGEVHGFEFQAYRKDGEVIWVSEDARAVKESSGRLLYYEGYIQDNTARKAAEEKLKENEEKFSKAFYAHSTAMQIIDLEDGKRVDFNKNLMALTGYTREELSQSDIYTLSLWKEPKSQKTVLKKLVKDGFISRYPMEIVTKSGQTKNVLMSAAILELEGKNWVIESLVDITERKQAEDALQASEQRYRQIYARVPISIWEEDFSEVGDWLAALKARGIHDLEAFLQDEPQALEQALALVRLTDINDTTLQLFEASSKDELLRLWPSLFTEDTFRIFTEELRAIWEGRNQLDFECSAQTVRGRPIHYIMHWVTPLKDGQMDLHHVIVALADITEQKQTEIELFQSKKNLAEAERVAQVGNWRRFPDHDQIYWSDGIYLIFDQTEETFGKTYEAFLELVHPDDRSHVMQANTDALEKGKEFNIEYRIVTSGGETKTISEIGRVVKDENGKIESLFGTAQDITLRKQAEEILKNSEERYRGIFEGVQDAIFVESLDGDILDVNQHACEMYGYTRAEFLAKRVADLVPSDREIIRFEEDHLGEHLNQPIETINVRANGEHFPVEITGGLFEGGDQKMYLVVLRDITERKQAEITLRESERRLNLALSGAQMGVWEWNLQTNGIFWSTKCFDIMGLSKEQFNEKLENFTNLVHPDDVKQVMSSAESAIKDKGAFDVDFRITRPDSELRWLANFGQAEYDQAGEPLRLIGMVQDITERKLAEENQRKITRQLEALFETASDLAGEQDLTTLLNTIVARAKELFNTQVAGIYLYDSAQDDLEMVAVTGYAVPVGTRLKAGEGMAGQVARTWQPLVVEDYRQWEGHSPQYKDVPFTSVLQVPMLYAGELIGVLAINEMAPNTRQFAEADTRLLTLLASAAAGAVRSARLYKETQQLSVFNKNILNYSPTGILTYKSTGECTYANERAAEIVGASVEQLKSQNFRTIESWKQSGLLALAERAIATNEITTSDVHHYSTFGKEVWMTANCVTFKSEDDEVNILLTITDIAERARAENLLRESEKLLKESQKIAGLGNYVLDIPTGIWTSSEVLDEVFGIDEAFDRSVEGWAKLIHPDERQQMIDYYTNEVIGKRTQFDKEYRIIRHNDKAVQWVHGLGKLEVDAQDQLVSMHGTIQDITERKQAEQALRKSEERFRLLFENTPIGLYRSTPDGKILAANPAFAQMLGYPKVEELLAVNVLDIFIDPDDREQELSQLKDEGDINHFKMQLKQRDGDVIWVRDTFRAVRNNEGQTLYFEGSLENITEQERAEGEIRGYVNRIEALLEIERALSSTLDLDEVLEIIMTELAKVIPYNTISLQVLQDDSLEIIASRGFEQPDKVVGLIFPLDPKFPNRRVIEGEKALAIEDITLEYPHFEKKSDKYESGNIRSWLGIPLISKGSVKGMIALDRSEVSPFSETEIQLATSIAGQAALAIEHARLYEETQRLAAFNQNIIQSMTEGIIIDNNDEMVTFANPSALAMLGYTSEELVGMYWKAIIPPDQHPVVQMANERRKRGEAGQYEVDLTCKDGQRITVLMSACPRLDKAEQFLGTIAVFTDITERMQALGALRQSEERYRTLIDQIPAIVYIDDASSNLGRTQFVSPYIEKMLGYSPEEWIQGGFDFWVEHLHPQDRERVLKDYQSVTQGKGTLDCEYRLLSKGGEVVWARDQASVLYDENSKPRTINGVIHDISARKKADEMLRESEQRFRLLFTTSPDAILLIDPHDPDVIWPIVDCNEAACQMNGYTREELVGQSIDVLNWTFENREEHDAYLEQVRSEGVIRLEGAHRHKDGHIFPIEFSTSVFTFEGRELILGIDRDISERKQTEAEIKRHIAELETLHESGLAISGLLVPEKIAQQIIEVLDKNLNWHHVAIRLYHPEDNRLEILALSQPGLTLEKAEDEKKRLNRMISTPDQGLSGWVVRHGVSVRCGNLSEEPRYKETFPGLNSGLYVPIQSGAVSIGSIAVESEEKNAFTDQDERLLITLANQAAIAFDNAKLYSRLQIELSERRYAEDRARKLNIELEQRVAARTAEIETAHQRMELAAAAAGIGVWELRAESEELVWDERVHKIYGTTPELFEKPTIAKWLNFVHPDDRKMVKKIWAQALEQDIPYQDEFRIIRADGSLRHVSSHAIVLFDEEHNYTSAVGVDMDITAIKQAEETLRLANTALERALRVKDEFLANMSHELRTPLNAILGLSQSLEEQIAGPLNEKQQKYIHTIGESGQHLLTLINDILDLAKIEAGQITLDIEKVNVQILCQASLRMVNQLAQKKEQDVSVEIDERVDLIWADERRLKQMIVNLLSNAVKFTPQGGKLGIRVNGDQFDNTVMITVWDNGIGIKDEDMERLFQPFVQLDASLDRESPGTGLGLALVAQMTRLHGGRIAVDSSPGEGSRFTITLPWKPAAHTGSLAKRQTGDLKNSSVISTEKKRTILLVEDTDAVVMMLKDYLESAGYHMTVARDGLEGITQAKRVQPDLILMDIMMPGMDGLEATRRIKSDTSIPDIPIIGLTALAMPSDRERCLAAGMSNYISKPVKLNELISVIQSHLSSEEEPKPR